MKLKDMVRFDKRVIEESNAQTKPQQVRFYIEQHPGANVKSIASVVFPDLSWTKAQQRAASVLFNMTAKNQLSRKKQDGYYRYYPANSLPQEVHSFFRCDQCNKDFDSAKALTMHKTRVHTEIGRQQTWAHTKKKPQTVFEEFAPVPYVAPVSLPKITSNIEQLAKDFYWETAHDSLREFVEWSKGKGIV